MRKLIALLSLAIVSFSSPAFAATCDAQASKKKLAGAAKNSSTKKCIQDSTGG